MHAFHLCLSEEIFLFEFVFVTKWAHTLDEK